MNFPVDIRGMVDGTYRGMLDLKEKLPRDEPYVRPSSCPACAVRLFVEVCAGRAKGGEFFEDQDFMREFYTECGTTTHEILQKWLGKTGKLVGDWTCACSIDKKTGKPKIVREFSTNNICPKCGAEARYSELEVDEDGIKGHVDGILQFKVDGKKAYIVIDFKGTSLQKVRDAAKKKPPCLPVKKHTKQITLYTYIFKNFKKLDVIGWALIYTARDNAMERYIAAKLFTKRDWLEAKDLFESQAHQQEILTKTLADGQVKRLLKHKLCTDSDHYYADVKDQYSACDYASICFSSPKRLLEILADAYSKMKTVNDKKR